MTREGVNTKIAYKKLSLSVEMINKVFLCVFLFNVVFIPNDSFHLKIISLLFLLIFNIPTLLHIKSFDEKVVVGLGLVLTSFAILWSIILTGEIITNIRMGYPGYILLLYPAIKKYSINFKRYLFFILKLLAYVVVVCALLDFTRILDMYSNPLLMWFSESENAMVGKGSELPIYYMIFIKTSPMFFFCLLDCLRRKQYLNSLVITAAIVLSGTRANLLMMVICLGVYFCFLHKSRKVRRFCLCAAVVAAVVLILDGRVVNFVIDMFTRKASSDDVRDGHLKGIFEVWKNSPLKFIIGSGFSTEFYSYGVEKMTANIELSYWNLLRQLGFFPFCFFVAMYLYPLFRLIKKREYTQSFAYLVYLAIAYTNPFLYSSTGVTVLLYVYLICFQKKQIKN